MGLFVNNDLPKKSSAENLSLSQTCRMKFGGTWVSVLSRLQKCSYKAQWSMMWETSGLHYTLEIPKEYNKSTFINPSHKDHTGFPRVWKLFYFEVGMYWQLWTIPSNQRIKSVTMWLNNKPSWAAPSFVVKCQNFIWNLKYAEIWGMIPCHRVTSLLG